MPQDTREGDGKFGKKREIQQGNHLPARERDHFSLRGDLGSICACQQACDQPPPPQFAAECCRLFRRSQSERGGVVWAPCLQRLSTARWIRRSPPRPFCSVRGSDNPSHLSRRSGEHTPPPRFIQPRLSKLLQSALECCSSQEFEFLPTPKSAHVRIGRNTNQPSRGLS